MLKTDTNAHCEKGKIDAEVVISDILHYTYSSFPLIQPFVVKLTQLAPFDKTSDTHKCMKLVNV